VGDVGVELAGRRGRTVGPNGTCAIIVLDVEHGGTRMSRKRTESPNYNAEICDIDHVGEVPQVVIESLPFTEAHPFRHRCSGCAYAAGLNAAIDSIEEPELVKMLRGENAQLRAELADLKAKLGAAP
jgi:hypothetical protein